MRRPDYPAFYIKDVGWIIRVKDYLPPAAFLNAKNYIEKTQLDRWRSCLPGDKKDLYKKALDDIRAGKIQQVFIDGPAGINAYKSTEKMTDTVYSVPSMSSLMGKFNFGKT